jgi:hypothetical protein
MIGTPEKLSQYLWQLDKEKRYEIKEYREKRSLNSNAYAWKLITELGNVLRKSKEEVYLQMLKDYGQSEIVSMLSSIDPGGYFKYYEKFGVGEVNGKEFTHYKIYKGSSEFDSKEMSIFIDGIVSECKSVGIQTLDSLEIEELIRREYDKNRSKS